MRNDQSSIYLGEIWHHLFNGDSGCSIFLKIDSFPQNRRTDSLYSFWLSSLMSSYDPIDRRRKHELVLSKSESVKFLLIDSVLCLFTDSPVENIYFTVKSVDLSLMESVEKIFSLLNQLIFTKAISEIWQIYSNLFLAI